MQVQMVEDNCFITMENGREQTYKLMSMLQDAGVVLHKYYWVSKFDSTCIELFEPKIFDAFKFQLDVIGNQKIVLNILQQFKQIQKEYKHLDECLYSKLSTNEIRNYATSVIHLNHQ